MEKQEPFFKWMVTNTDTADSGLKDRSKKYPQHEVTANNCTSVNLKGEHFNNVEENNSFSQHANRNVVMLIKGCQNVRYRNTRTMVSDSPVGRAQ